MRNFMLYFYKHNFLYQTNIFEIPIALTDSFVERFL